MLIIVAMLLGSVAVGFALNRFVLAKIAPGRNKVIALSISRAVFCAPSLINVGHGGVYLPFPLLLGIESAFHEFGPDLDVFIFLLPGIVFLWSLPTEMLKLKQTPNKPLNPDAQKRRAG